MAFAIPRVGFQRSLCLFAITLGLVTGCGSDSLPAPGNRGDGASESSEPESDGSPPMDGAAEHGTIGISVQTLANPFFKVIADTVVEQAGVHGYEVLVRDAQGKIEFQNNQVKEFVVKRVSAILLCPRDTKAIGSVIREANEAGIPVFTIDTKCEDPQADVVQHVGTDNFQGGEVAGQAMIDALGPAGGKVAILEFRDVESCIDRVRGFMKRITDHNADAANPIEVVANLESRGDKEEGQNAARDAVNSHPDLIGIFAINDPAALGARAALEAEGIEGRIVVIGFDGMPEAKQAVKEGRLFDTPVQFPDEMAKASVTAMLQYFDGEVPEKSILIPTAAYRQADAQHDPSL